MKYLWPLTSILMLLSAACTKEIDLKPDPRSENTVITFYVDLIGQPDKNTLKIFDNYDYFLKDTLPLKTSWEYTDYRYARSIHTFVFSKDNEKELWLRVNSLTFSYPFFNRDFIYKSSIFVPLTDSLLIEAGYENWILE